MREATMFWKRARLPLLANLNLVVTVMKSAHFMGYLERNPKTVRILCRMVCNVGYTPTDLNDSELYEIEEILVEPDDYSQSWIVVINIRHPLTLFSARTGGMTVCQGSRLDEDGLYYIMRGSAMAIRAVLSTARSMLKPDRISTAGVATEDLSGNPILTPRQKEVVEAAFKAGWYSTPRKISLADLATSLGLGRSTVSEHLINAESALVEHYLEGDPMLKDD